LASSVNPCLFAHIAIEPRKPGWYGKAGQAACSGLGRQPRRRTDHRTPPCCAALLAGLGAPGPVAPDRTTGAVGWSTKRRPVKKPMRWPLLPAPGSRSHRSW